jgi:hypothetical protein
MANDFLGANPMILLRTGCLIGSSISIVLSFFVHGETQAVEILYAILGIVTYTMLNEDKK